MTRDFLKPQKIGGLDTNTQAGQRSRFASRPFARIPKPEMSPQDIQTMRERAARAGNPMAKALGIPQPTVQREELPEEEKQENLQMKANESVQQQEMEEEEDLQMKPEPSLQRQEMEEEENLQMQSEPTLQRQELLEEEEDKTLQMQSEDAVQLKCQDCEQEKVEVQPKLTIGAPGDKYEQEADRVAAQVVQRINAPATPPLSSPNGDGENKIQRKPVIPLLQRVPQSSEEIREQGRENLFQRSEFSQRVSRQGVEASIPNVQGNFERTLNRAKGGGLPLDRAFRGKVEPEMGADFSGVKVHTDSEADQLSQSIQAKAFTTGEDIFFKKGEYEPGSQQGQELLAHELTHVVQQNYHQPQSQIVQQVSNQEIINAFFDEIWDKITETTTDIWNAFTNVKSNTVNSGGDNNQTSDIVQLQIPDGEFTVTDAKAIIRRPPPDLTSESGKPLIAKGSQVLILEGVRKGGKDYVRVQETMPSEFQGPLQNSGWTAASNIEGLSQTLLTLNPATKKTEVVVPKPSSQEILGLPDQPQVEHPEFTSIFQEIEQMEQNPLGVEKKHREETGDERTKRVEKIGQLRQRIATLGEKIPELEASQVQKSQAYLYRRLAPLAPYFGQMANTNILQGKEKGNYGWKRTCNVTVPAMVIEGLGKTKDNYDQSKVPLLKKIFNALEGKYKERQKYDTATDFNALRLPDFMALVGIARLMPEGSESLADDQFIKVVSEKRKEAAEKTTNRHGR